MPELSAEAKTPCDPIPLLTDKSYATFVRNYSDIKESLGECSIRHRSAVKAYNSVRDTLNK